jgi:hypothetical protein
MLHLVWLSLLGSSGCGPSEAGTKPQEQPSSESEFADAFAAAFCGGLETCCGRESRTFSEASCDSSVRQALAAEQPSGDSLRFDQQAADACLANVATAVAACEGIEREPCNRIYVGTRATGDACQAERECAPVEGARVACTNGMCKAARRAKVAEPCVRTCTSEDECGRLDGEPPIDLSTTSSWGDCFVADGLACISGSCVRAPGEGAACLGSVACDVGLDCREGDVCAPYAAIGSACGVCAPSAYCDGSNQCAAKLPLGAACDYDDACASARCDSVCVTPTLGQAHGSAAECAGQVSL